MRIERCKRVLKNHLHMTPCLMQLRLFHGQYINAVYVHTA